MVVSEQAQVLAAAWANDDAVNMLAVNHSLARLSAKQKLNRSILLERLHLSCGLCFAEQLCLVLAWMRHTQR